MTNHLTIGRLAAAADVNVETIRYYQRRDLLDEPPRPLGGQRYYSDDHIKRLRFIRRAQGLGFTLEEVRELLAMDRGRGCIDTRELAVKKQVIIEQKLNDLRAIQGALGSLVAQCDRHNQVVGCPILEALGGASLVDEGERA